MAEGTSQAVLAVRQYLASDVPQFGLSRRPPDGPSFSVSGRAPSASEIAQIRAEGVTAVSLSVNTPAGAARIRVTVLDSRGRVVRRAVDDAVESGTYVFRWDGLSDGGTRMPSGIYQVVVDGLGQRQRTTLVLTR
jgi:flagellar hook assembly protein FlgD